MWIKLLLALLSALAISAVLLRWWQKRILRKYKLKEIDVPVVPLFGHALIGIKGVDDCSDKILQYLLLSNKQGGVVTMWAGGIPILVITDPVNAEYILKNHLNKEGLYKMGQPFTGNGSLTAEVSIWRQRRKIFAPLFAPKTLSLFMDIFAKQSLVMTKLMQKASGRGPTELWNYIANYTFDTVCNSALGININAQNNLKHPFLKSFNNVVDHLTHRVISPWLYSDLIYKMSPSYHALMKDKKDLYDFIEKVVKSKEEKVNPDELRHKIPDLLDLLNQSKDGCTLSMVEQCEETMVIALAGQDTSAVSIAFVLHMLARHQQVQERVYQELMEVFNDANKPVTEEEILKLQYLELVIKETMRLYPPVTIIARTVKTESVLPSGEIIPKDTFVVIGIYGIHRNEHYWGADANRFRPERFLEPFKHPKQFIPFSDGPRNCIGYKYAMMSMKAALATMLRKYKVYLPSDTRPNGKISCDIPEQCSCSSIKFRIDIIIKDKENVRLCLELRNN